MTEKHPITPPPGLIKNWCASRIHEKQDVPLHVHVAIQAARWGADQELEWCVSYVDNNVSGNKARALRAARRPKPPSLKEQALTALTRYTTGETILTNESVDTIRRALEQLDD